MSVMTDEEGRFLNSTFPRECENCYCDSHHKLIVTGDFRFISNFKFSELFSKGLNYCENKMINYKKCKDSIKAALLSSIESLSAKYDLTKDAFTAWYDTIISKVEERMSHLMVKFEF